MKSCCGVVGRLFQLLGGGLHDSSQQHVGRVQAVLTSGVKSHLPLLESPQQCRRHGTIVLIPYPVTAVPAAQASHGWDQSV